MLPLNSHFHIITHQVIFRLSHLVIQIGPMTSQIMIMIKESRMAILKVMCNIYFIIRLFFHYFQKTSHLTKSLENHFILSHIKLFVYVVSDLTKLFQSLFKVFLDSIYLRALCIFCETLKQSNKNVYTIDFEKTEESLKPAQTKNLKKKDFLILNIL